MSPSEITKGSNSPDESWGVEGDKKRLEIFYNGYYYDVTNFVKRHPGGREIIGYYTNPNEDATIPIQQFHNRSLDKVLGIMKGFKKRPATEIAGSTEDSETRARNKALTQDFTNLFLEMKAEGLFEPSYTHIIYRLVELVMITILGLYLITEYSNPLTRLLGCFVFSMAQGRAGWVMHEGGHMSLTGNPKMDRYIQIYTAGIVMGWSAIFWRRHHNLHHAMTQRLQRDIDLDLSPIFLLNIDAIKDSKEKDNFLLRNQLILSPFLSLVAALYNLFVESGGCLFRYRIRDEFIAIGIHYVGAYYVGFWPWLTCQWITISYLFINFGINHTHLPVTNKPTHWVEHGLVHTADVDQRPWCDWWMGYLNYQVEHHLFPTMPQFRNKLAVGRVRALAQKYGLPYHVLSYGEGIKKMTKNVWNVSQQLKKL